MEKKRAMGLTVIGISEYLFGLVGFFLLVFHVSYSMSFNREQAWGIGLVVFLAWSSFLLLGIGILLKNKIALIANRVILPPMIFIQIVMFIAGGIIGFPRKGGGIFLLVLVSFIVAGIYILIYLSRPKVKEQFKKE